MSAVHSYSGSFDHLVFDLDDTLLDTSRILIPRASRAACEAMISAGLNADLEPCLAKRDEHLRNTPRQDLYTRLVEEFGVKNGADPRDVARKGHEAFYNREVENDIELLPGARDLIATLSELYGIHLVTAGHRPTQESKIRLLKIEPLFDTVSHVDPSRGERKRDAFLEIMRKTRSLPVRHLSIGNRLDTDISEARMLGWKGCWLKYGEYASMLPSTEHEQPDYIISSLEELAETCRL